MTLVKQSLDLSFAQGLDLKTDPKRLQFGKFLQLQNSIFTKGGLLQKRNGYGQLSSLPDTSYSYLTTFNDNLTALGADIAAYNNAAASWIPKGVLQPLTLSTLPVIRNNLNQTTCDVTVAPNGVACCVYNETNGSTTTVKFVVFDSVTGQNLAAPAPVTVTSGTVSGGARVFYTPNNFIIVFTNEIVSTYHLQFIAVSAQNPSTITTNIDIATYVPATTVSWDGFVANNNLYLAYNTITGGQSVQMVFISRNLTISAPATFAGYIATTMSVTADISSVQIYATFQNSATTYTYYLVVDQNLNTILAPTFLGSGLTIANIATVAQKGGVSIFFENINAYSWTSNLPANYINFLFATNSGVITSSGTSVRGVGLSSKAFLINGYAYYLAAYQSPYQSTYFLINGSLSTEASPVIAAKLAYSNGGGYLPEGLPSVTVTGTTAQISYLYKDLIQAVNKNTAIPTGNQTAGIYSQTGVNLVSFTFGTQGTDTAEIGNDLHITGGFLSMYDGYLPVEHNFFLWPDTDQTTPTDTATWSDTGGSILANPPGWVAGVPSYYYQFTYEWTDNQGNAFRSAPSIPIPVTTSGDSSIIGSVTLNIPTLRLTMKVANPVKICVYRWSVAQQEYYQVGNNGASPITSPVLNSTTTDTVTFTDTLADANILGNNLLYTTGGVVEDVNAPSSSVLALFDTRLWLVDAEDPNLLWYSKQVIEATPVEMSDLLTLYVPPSTSTQGTTGPITALAPMDDKLVIFKANAIYYINGTGPDNTGANNQYSAPTFVTSTVGCANQNSIVFMPQGLMFQSDKGIWLLDRGLGTTYIGAPVENFNTSIVNSAVNVPATNQVRFTLSTGQTLMYDYYYGQWGTFVGVPAISSCIWQGLHSFIDSYGRVFQESDGQYLDGSNPVQMMFQTGPLRLGDLQNYQRAYFFYLLGTYISPHKLQIGLIYDYDTNPSQTIIISPTNYSAPYGSGPLQSPYGQGDPYGGGTVLESWRIFPERQRCMAISFQLQEIFDPTFGTAAGAGLTLSGLNVVLGFKKGYRPQSAANTAG